MNSLRKDNLFAQYLNVDPKQDRFEDFIKLFSDWDEPLFGLTHPQLACNSLFEAVSTALRHLNMEFPYYQLRQSSSILLHLGDHLEQVEMPFNAVPTEYLLMMYANSEAENNLLVPVRKFEGAIAQMFSSVLNVIVIELLTDSEKHFDFKFLDMNTTTGEVGELSNLWQQRDIVARQSPTDIFILHHVGRQTYCAMYDDALETQNNLGQQIRERVHGLIERGLRSIAVLPSLQVTPPEHHPSNWVQGVIVPQDHLQHKPAFNSAAVWSVSGQARLLQQRNFYKEMIAVINSHIAAHRVYGPPEQLNQLNFRKLRLQTGGFKDPVVNGALQVKLREERMRLTASLQREVEEDVASMVSCFSPADLLMQRFSELWVQNDPSLTETELEETVWPENFDAFEENRVERRGQA